MPKPEEFPISFYPCFPLTWNLEECLSRTQMVNGHEPPSGRKNPLVPTGVTLLLASGRISFLPLGSSNFRYPSVAWNIAVNASGSSIRPFLSTYMQVTHNKLHNCTVWSCLFCFSVSKFLFISEATIRNHHIPTVFLHLTYSLSIMPSRAMDVVANGKIMFFLWLSAVPLHIYTISSLSIHLSMGT